MIFKFGFGAIGCHGGIYFCVWGIFSIQGCMYFGVWGNWQSGEIYFEVLWQLAGSVLFFLMHVSE